MTNKPGGRRSSPRKRKPKTQQPQQDKPQRPVVDPEKVKSAKHRGQNDEIRLAAVEQQALDLRLAGLSYRAIAEQMGVSPAGAHKIVQRVVERSAKENSRKAEHLREVQTLRIERLILAIWSRALGKPARVENGQTIPAVPPDLEAGKTIAGVYIPQIAKLHGLYQAEEMVISGGPDPVKVTMQEFPDEDLHAILDIFRRRTDSHTAASEPRRIPPSRLTGGENN